MSRRYRLALGSQIPERSGWPSGVRGAAPERLALPSAVLGMPFDGRFFHCAASGQDNNIAATRQVRNLECIAAFRFAYDYIPVGYATQLLRTVVSAVTEPLDAILIE